MNVLIGVVCRWIFGHTPNVIILYGHKLNGNLKSLYDFVTRDNGTRYRVRYLSMDKAYVDDLRRDGIDCLSAARTRDMIKACRAACIVTDHGTHSLRFLLIATSTVFIDVWHGIPFKGFDAVDFSHLHPYRAAFVASPSMQHIYETRYGFKPQQLFVTGYGRTDRLFSGGYDKEEILARVGIDQGVKKTILIAPTWHHGSNATAVTELNILDPALMCRLQMLATSLQAVFIMRTHLNTSLPSPVESEYFRFLPTTQFVDTEQLLFVSDVLVSDWSSIVFDYLVLKRPTIFLDVPSPFKKGFTYGPEYRFGAVVRSMPELEDQLKLACAEPNNFLTHYLEKMEQVTSEIYDGFLDGRASERYLKNIEHIIGG